MVADATRSLLERRLVIVTGKGGTGKTTVAATLAIAGQRAGLNVLLAEMTQDEHLPRLISPGVGLVGHAGRSLRPGLTVLRIDPLEALSEYLSLQIGLRAVVDVVMRNQGFQQLLNAAPGWRELITLGKLWHLEQFEATAGIPLYDLIVVDAPATGHGVTFLDVPRVVVSAVRTGPLRRNAELVEAMIRDHRRTLLLPVCLAEELPVRETVELVERAREIGIAVDRVVVNALLEAPFEEDLDLATLLAKLPEDAAVGDLPRPSELAACAAYVASRHQLNRNHAEVVGPATGLPTVTLPYLATGIRGPNDLEVLCEPLIAQPVRGALA